MAWPMNFLIDGYNYLRRANLFRGAALEVARRRLAERLRPLARAGDRVTIVWDARNAPGGLPSEETAGGARHVFARRSASADDEILLRLRNAEKPRSYCVVSDDTDITRPAKQLGAAVLSIRDAEMRLAAAGRPPIEQGEDDDEKPPPPRGNEIQEWLDLFGRDENAD
jgi:predicted RNA-binding protein with PIN domain